MRGCEVSWVRRLQLPLHPRRLAVLGLLLLLLQLGCGSLQRREAAWAGRRQLLLPPEVLLGLLLLLLLLLLGYQLGLVGWCGARVQVRTRLPVP